MAIGVDYVHDDFFIEVIVGNGYCIANWWYCLYYYDYELFSLLWFINYYFHTVVRICYYR